MKHSQRRSAPFSRSLSLCLGLSLSASIGCDKPNQGARPVVTPSAYSFDSRFEEETSGVSYSGQVARHALLNALVTRIEGLSARLLAGELSPAEGELVAEFELFYDCADDLCVEEPHQLSLDRPFKQETLGAISSGKGLSEKVAGRDEVGQRRDWSRGLIGWEGSLSPDELVRSWFEQIERQAIEIAEGEPPLSPLGEALDRPEISPDGLHFAELIEKFLFGALAYSQAADDYLDDDLEGKGLLSDHLADDGGYTALEHAWDEGFGYFGAARDMSLYSLEELAGVGGRPEFQRAHDSDGDGLIDLKSEYNWSFARYAASRDLSGGSDFGARVFEAFLKGRALISAAEGALSPTQLEELQGYRDEALEAWEGVIGASAVHYLNEVLTYHEAQASYDFASHAKHWSELKGFALSLQFNPRSAFSDEDLERLHEAIGQRLTPPSEDGSAARVEVLLNARALIAARLDFSEEQLEAW